MAWDAFGSRTERGVRGEVRLDGGFTLVEVMIAMMLLLSLSLGLAGLFATAIRATHAARTQTSTTVLAEQRMEQLRALTWGFDESGQNLPVSDTTTNLSLNPPTADGRGLNPSPTDSLNANRAGYVDFLDARGQWIGAGTVPPANTVFIRRWSVQPLPTNPNNTLVLQVLVTTARREAGVTGGGTRRRYADDALIATVKTRKAR
jgi:prepilin-type N-terminal cleavage/methylation domain-containing protein